MADFAEMHRRGRGITVCEQCQAGVPEDRPSIDVPLRSKHDARGSGYDRWRRPNKIVGR